MERLLAGTKPGEKKGVKSALNRGWGGRREKAGERCCACSRGGKVLRGHQRAEVARTARMVGSEPPESHVPRSGSCCDCAPRRAGWSTAAWSGPAGPERRKLVTTWDRTYPPPPTERLMGVTGRGCIAGRPYLRTVVCTVRTRAVVASPTQQLENKEENVKLARK